jgi:hypothetical protein
MIFLGAGSEGVIATGPVGADFKATRLIAFTSATNPAGNKKATASCHISRFNYPDKIILKRQWEIIKFPIGIDDIALDPRRSGRGGVEGKRGEHRAKVSPRKTWPTVNKVVMGLQ